VRGYDPGRFLEEILEKSRRPKRIEPQMIQKRRGGGFTG
jgi:hypothetical protein